MPIADLTEELSYELLDRFGNSLVFGGDTSGFIVEDIEDSEVDIRDNDSERPREDGVDFGVDFFNGQVLTFKIVVDKNPYPFTEPGPLDPFAKLRRAWRAADVRSRSGEVCTLRMRKGGRIRRVYGRPRRFSPTSERDRWGWQTALCDFKCSDDLFYGDNEVTNTVTIVPPPAGGYEVPVTFPWGSDGIAYAPGVVHIDGDEPAWPTFKIIGPINNPIIDCVGHWKIGLSINLLAGQSIGVDPRPWSRGVRRENGLNVANAMTAGSPTLQELRLPPGGYEIVLRGQDNTGTAQMITAWRPTYTSR